MLNKGEEMFIFEGEFFKLAKKYFEMDKVGDKSGEMLREFDELHRRYLGINKLYDEYVKSRLEWFLVMVTKKERYEEEREGL